MRQQFIEGSEIQTYMIRGRDKLRHIDLELVAVVDNALGVLGQHGGVQHVL